MKHWDPKSLYWLDKYFPVKSPTDLETFFGRSWKAIETKAHRRGLSRRNRKILSLNAVADKIGYSRGTTRKIIQWAGIKSAMVQGHGKRTETFFDLEDVSLAASDWMRSETPVAAADRLGMSMHRLYKQLQNSRFKPFNVSGKVRHYRLMPWEWDTLRT